MKKQLHTGFKKRAAWAGSIRLALESRLLFDGAVIPETTEAVSNKSAPEGKSSLESANEAIQDSHNNGGQPLKPEFAFIELSHPTKINSQGFAITSAASARFDNISNLMNVNSTDAKPPPMQASLFPDTQGKKVNIIKNGNQQLIEDFHPYRQVNSLQITSSEYGKKVENTDNVAATGNALFSEAAHNRKIENAAGVSGTNTGWDDTAHHLMVAGMEAEEKTAAQSKGVWSPVSSISDRLALNANNNYSYSADNANSRGVEASVIAKGLSGGVFNTASPLIAAVNNPPILDLDGNNSSGAIGAGYTTSYTENAAGVAIADNDISITDTDNTTIAGASITITNRQTGDFIGALSSLPAGISASSYSSSTGILRLSGTSSLANYENAIKAIGYRSTSENPNTTARAITVVLNDGLANSNTVTTTVNTSAVNDAPTVSMPVSVPVTEDVPVAITGIVFADVDGGNTGVDVTLFLPAGTGKLSWTNTAFISAVISNNGESLTLGGTKAAINSAIAEGKLVYTPSENNTGNVALRVTVDDRGNTGNDPGLSGAATTEAGSGITSMVISQVNDAPVSILPATFNVNEDVALQLRGLSVADVDAGSGQITVTLAVASGSLMASPGGGVAIGGSGRGTLTLTGSLANINSFLAGSSAPSYAPASDFNGTVNLSMIGNDGGNTGTGGALTGNGSSAITVTPVVDITADNLTTNANTPLSYNPITGTNGASADNFEGTPSITAINGTAIAVGGTVGVANGSVTLGSGNVIIFTPTNNFTGTTTYTYTVSSGGVTETATETIIIPPQISINDVAVDEAAGAATFTVSLSSASGLPVSVNYSINDGTATAGADFTGASGTLTFAPGVTSQIIAVTLSEDTLFEGSETFNINLTGATNASIADNLGLGTITDNDPVPAVDSVSAAVAAEGGNLVHTVTLSNASSTPITFPFSLAGTTAIAGIDFNNAAITFSDGVTLASGVLTIPAGVTSFTVTYATVDDVLDEANETTALTIGGVTGAGAIIDDDPAPSISINDVTVDEAAGAATFTVSLSSASGLPVSVNYSINDGSAAAGADFTGASGTLTFAPGVTSQTITVTLSEDTLFEGSETFNINLTGATNASIADNLGLGTITDNDPVPAATISVNPASVIEDDAANLVYTVSLSNPSSVPVTINLTVSGTAANSDYTGAVTSVTIPAGSTSAVITLDPTIDALDETDETVAVSIAPGTNYTIGVTSSATGTVIDDDPTPSISIDDVTVDEAAGTAAFTVSLSSVSGLPVSMNYSVNDGSATAGADFTGAGGTLSFAPGVIAQTIVVPITADSILEGNENFTVFLSGAANATIADSTGLATITDTTALTVSIGDAVAVDEGGNLIYTVTLSGTSITDLVIPLAYSGAAAGGSDYRSIAFITIPAGASTGALTIAAIADNLIEGIETVVVNLGTPAGLPTGAPAIGIADGQGSGLINNTDAAPVARNDGPFSTTPNSPVSGNVITNDSDPDGDRIKVSSFAIAGVGAFPAGSSAAIPGVGAILIGSNGAFIFTPNTGYKGPVPAVSYTVTDGVNTDTGILTFTDVPNVKPVAADDKPAPVTPNTPARGNVLTNNTDPNGDPIKVVGFSIAGLGEFPAGAAAAIPGVGIIKLGSNGDFLFIPDINYAGSVPLIIYTVSDGSGTDQGSLSLSVAEEKVGNIGAQILLSNPTPNLFPESNNRPYSLFPFIEVGPEWNSEESYRPSRLSLYGNLPGYDLYLTGTLRNQVVIEHHGYSFTIPSGTFRHSNANEQLEYVATQLDESPLPSWLNFDAKLLKFYGLPPKGALNVEVLVTASDRYGNEAYATFKIIVNKDVKEVRGKNLSHKFNHIADKNIGIPSGKAGFNEQIGQMGKLSRLMESRALIESLNQLNKHGVFG